LIGLDSTIMNIALPSAQRSLDTSDPVRSWLITSFALGYGGLLLLGGRISDLIGRRRSLLIGLTGFALASALGGAAVDPAMLLTARALQGGFGALVTPSVLGTVAVAFPLPAERGKAFGIYGTVLCSASAWAWRSAGCSPTTWTGAGACTWTCPSRWRRQSECCTRSVPCPAPPDYGSTSSAPSSPQRA
jgi:MFS family permease